MYFDTQKTESKGRHRVRKPQSPDYFCSDALGPLDLTHPKRNCRSSEVCITHRPPLSGAGQLTFAEESADHEAEGDGGDSKAGQKDQHQRGVTLREHCHVLLHLCGHPVGRWGRVGAG